MTEKIYIEPNYLFETSWEVCNMVGGIYTVLSSKYESMKNGLGDRYIFVGPDVWKETSANPDFTEDSKLYADWRKSAEREGLKIKIGRWNIPGKPVAVLVDFTPYFEKKDEILAKFWESYKLDSISGGWDYIEPALFGYATGKVIESFYNFYLSANEKILAHFHEWMTGSGVLYLEENTPQIGTVFTTHATSLGRSVAGNSMPLYNDLEFYNPTELAKQLGVVSKFSLEKISANEADCFTTVSDITAKECSKFLGREVDVVTPNGFSNSFRPEQKDLEESRKQARKRIVDVTEAILNQKIEDDALMVLTSGRYEFNNKGLDVYIDALADLNKKEISRQVVAFITVPGNHAGPRQDVKKQVGNPNFNMPATEQYLTHTLYDTINDPVITRLKEKNLLNDKNSKVKVIFVPVYLNGKDGIFDLDYYQFLNGMDISVFPSYYEPWGYTPMESITFGVPTLTTSLAGFGAWVRDFIDIKNSAVTVIDRNDTNYSEVISEVTDVLVSFANASAVDLNRSRQESFITSEKFYWEELAEKYREAYSIAIEKVNNRADLFKGKQSVELQIAKNGTSLKPEWKKVYVKAQIPEALVPLQKLAMNLWWSWNHEAIKLFENIDKQMWIEVNYNPLSLLNRLSFERMHDLLLDQDFMIRMEGVYEAFTSYMDEKKSMPKEKVAYFSMEYGLHESIKIYSGGLGILAGDYLKEASDSNKNIIGVGLMYRYGYFKQRLSYFGDQIPEKLPQKYTELPLQPVRNENGDWVKVGIALPGRTLYAKIWRLDVGRVPLYLLDADISDNSYEDRSITYQLYGGDWHNRFKQELLLGVGGVRFLYSMNAKPDIYHLNEGHAAFTGLERLRHLVEERGMSFGCAVEIIRSTSLFTTHTPVPAGHDTFSEDILRTYVPHYADRINLSWNEFMDLGRFKKGNHEEKFSMSVLAAKFSQEMNGVSKIHGRVSRGMFNDLYPGYFPEELHIGHVTNGVHYPTWTATHWQKFYSSKFGQGFLKDQSNPEYWKKIHRLSDQVVWKQRLKAKSSFVKFLKEKLQEDLTARQENPRIKLNILEGIDENALIIGFARRFATYKRAHLLFTDLNKLSKLVNDPDRPLHFVFAGKAHPNDNPGQDLIKRIVEISKMPEFVGKVIFLENYDMTIGRKLVSGVDIWLNTPTRPLEASGTSGEKAIMNGVVNFSVLDGWWAEGYKDGAGLAIQEAKTYINQSFQDEFDAETIYRMLEDEILPMYFDRDKDDVPHKWVSYVKNTISDVAPHFTMKRMLEDYYDQFYSKLFDRSVLIRKNNNELAKEIEQWKYYMREKWDGIEAISVRVPDSTTRPLDLGDDFDVELTLNTNGIKSSDLGIDLVLGQKVKDEVHDVLQVVDLKLTDHSNGKSKFAGSINLKVSGVFDFAFRIYPKADFLPHRQDFNLVKWI